MQLQLQRLCEGKGKKTRCPTDEERRKRGRRRHWRWEGRRENARKRGHSERVRALHLIPLSGECASLGYFRDIGPERVASETRIYIYTYMYVSICTRGYRLYVYIYVDASTDRV